MHLFFTAPVLVIRNSLQPDSLMPFVGNPRQPMPDGLPYNLVDYIQLLDWTGRQIRDDKRGSISDETPPVIQRINVSAEHWLQLATQFESQFKGIAGSAHSIKALCSKFGLTRKTNYSNSKLLFC